jgi:hypothetical protein
MLRGLVRGDLLLISRAEGAARVWSFRTRAEREAALRFDRLADELSAHGAQAQVVALARQAARDEDRHVLLCAALAYRFGARREPPAPRAAPARAPSGLGRREALLYEVVAMACVTETLSAALLGEMHARAEDALVRRTIHRVLRDEIRHSRLGWAHLAAEQGELPAAMLADYLPAMLAGTVSDELFSSAGDAAAELALDGLGALRRVRRRAIFEDTMRAVVFPGLEHFGIDSAAGERWLASKPAALAEPVS